MPARNRSIVDKRAFGQAMSRMKAFLPMDNWPQPMLRLFFGAQTLSWMQRLRLITFLVGNGYPIDALHTVMAHRMRTSAATIHANHVTRDILSGRYDRTWFYFNVTEQDLSDRHDYLFARHENCKGLMQGQKKISGKMAFTPANLESATHKRLTRAIDSRHVKTKQTQKFIAVTDPEREKAAMDAEAERIMKEQDAAKKRQNAAMGGGGHGRGGSGRAPRGYTEDYYAKYDDEDQMDCLLYTSDAADE